MNDFSIRIMKLMEEKLIELMGQEAYTAFAAKIARDAFREEVDGMAESDFKNFIMENFEEITK